MPEWETMTPRERDALVAERVIRDPDDYGQYTSDIAATWRVVEEMQSRMSLWLSVGQKDSSAWWGHYVVSFIDKTTGMSYETNPMDPSAPRARAMAEEFPEAVCLAALRAHGVDV